MNIKRMQRAAHEAADLMRCLANENRLLIACQLAGGERSVGTICETLGMRQAAVSQQLARLRRDGIVATRRDAQTIYYSLASDHVGSIVALLYARFCGRSAARRRKGRTAGVQS